jgi:glycosyltransferase involved in cell wall biosynthesis
MSVNRVSNVRRDVKRVLMIAFYFPPMTGTSGIQRTLRFARHLPHFGWEPLILTAHPRAYERVSDDLMKEISPGTVVERAFALDAARQLSLRGRYPALAARPDRWISWWLGAVPRGMAMIRKYRPHALWSTYPIATAHKIGHTLQRLSGLPWIADFRDPMAQEGYPADPKTWRSYKAIEEATLRRAARSVFVTPGAARMYRDRYTGCAGRISVIENGYDEESFEGLPAGTPLEPLVPGKITLLHSGVVYPSERDPTHFFEALRRMVGDGTLRSGELAVRLRAAGHDDFLRKLIDQNRLGELVELAPPLPYRDALHEMMRADGLLVLQASNCNDQVPAKLYEYLRCGRPIVGLTDPAGDTAGVLRSAGLDHIARLDSAEEITRVLKRFIEQLRTGAVSLPREAFVTSAARRDRARALAGLLEGATACHG